MRHRSPHLLLDLLRFGRPTTPRAKLALAATAVAALGGTSTAVALAAHDTTAPDQPSASGTARPTSSSSLGSRVPSPSRSAGRHAATPQTMPSSTATPTPSPGQPSATPGLPGQLGRVPAASATASAPAPGSTTPTPGDRTAPQTSAVTLTHAGGTWTLTLTASEVGTFRCSLDGAAYRSCTASPAFTGLASGRHTLAVQAVDLAGNSDPSPAEVTTQVTGGGDGQGVL